VIDPAKGRVMAANAAGAARMGLHPDAASGALDAAMPGLVRLRALMHEPLNGGRREPLIFWTAYGAESLYCDVKAIPQSSELVLVTLGGAEEEATPMLPSPPPRPAIAPSEEDTATMKRIAHAIRTGFGTDGSEPGNDAARDDAESSPGAAGDEDDVEVSKLAHELRTPLSAIVVAAEIMKDQRLGELANERYRSYSADIADNARHALAVINRLLGEAAAASGAGLESKPLDLNALAEGAVSAMRPLAEEAKLTLTQELHTRLPAVLADAMTVKQILFNLLTNAVKFTKPPGDVRVVTGLGFDRSVFIAVQDQGAGMTPEEIARALDAEAPPKPEPKQAGGLGIGLPLAVSLAKANGARLEIDSKPGEGTAVALIFPKDRVATTP
jgi:hypothetical protein